VLGGDGVGEQEGLLEVPHTDQGPAPRERGTDDGGAFHPWQLALEARGYGLDEVGIRA
jgi:hypothetical protein